MGYGPGLGYGRHFRRHPFEHFLERTPTGFQVPGWVNLHEYKVGDHLLASVGINNTLIAYLRKTPPPTGDKQYEEALRRLLAEEGRTP